MNLQARWVYRKWAFRGVLAVIVFYGAYISSPLWSLSHVGITENDTHFMMLIRSKLKEKNDESKVVDIYSGDWKEVCVISGGNSNAKYLITDNVSMFDNIVIKNGSSPYASDQISLVAFIYSDNLMEVFRSKETDISFGVSKSLVKKKRGCLRQDDAYFKVVGKYSKSNPNGNFHIDVQLASKGEL